MTKMSSTMFSVGTLLRRAEDTGAQVRVLVQSNWLVGRVLADQGDDEGARSAWIAALECDPACVGAAGHP